MAGWCRPESLPPVTSVFHFYLLSSTRYLLFPSLPPSWLDPFPPSPSLPLFFLLTGSPATPGLCWPCSFLYFLHSPTINLAFLHTQNIELLYIKKEARSGCLQIYVPVMYDTHFTLSFSMYKSSIFHVCRNMRFMVVGIKILQVDSSLFFWMKRMMIILLNLQEKHPANI